MKYRAARVVVLSLAAGVVAYGGYALAASVAVTMTPTGPQPATVTANLGDTLTWANAGSASYVVTSARLDLTSPPIPPGGSYEHVVIRSGSFGYQQQGPDRRSTFKGTVVVLRSGKVTLSTRRESVLYGSRVALTGVTTLPAFPVVIESRPVRERSWLPFRTLTPAPDGAFSITVKPNVGATYRANVLDNELVSKTLSLDVRPRVTIRSSARKLPGGRSVTLTVRVVPAAAAGSVEIMAYDRKQEQWRRITTRRLSGKGVATYRWTVPYGRTLLRGWLKLKNLEAGYAESHSSQILVQGTGSPPGEKQPNRRPRNEPRGG